jgi:hypothetical protein
VQIYLHKGSTPLISLVKELKRTKPYNNQIRLLTYNDHDEPYVTRDLVNNIPPYTILSHTWGPDDKEVIYHELRHESSKMKVKYQKI